MADTSSTDVSKYVDVNYLGFQSSLSLALQYPFTLTGVEALKNAIKMYLMSSPGDYGRNLTKGGPLYTVIGKEMNDSSKQNLLKLITKAINSYSTVVVQSIDIQQDVMNKRWLIKIFFADTYNKYVSSLGIAVPTA